MSEKMTVLNIRMSADEKREIKERAELSGQTISSYARDLLFSIDNTEDKKDNTVKSNDSSDIKKIDEVISQVMDKKNPDYLLKYNAEELALIRNTLYARRGLKYTKGKYKTYFEGKSWYKPSVTSGKDLLPEKEEKLVEIIGKYEKKAKK